MCFSFRKKKFDFFSFALIFCSAVLFFSCANENQIDESFSEEDTLRFTAERLYTATNWTEEVEEGRLSASVSSVKGISRSLSLNPLIVAASTPENAIFPNLSSFGSLDTTLIPDELRKTLNDFCNSISTSEDGQAENFFKKENIFTLALFYNDFKRIFEDCFKINEFEKKLADWQTEMQKNSSENSESPDSQKKSKKPELVFFTKNFLGQPFLDGIYYEVPAKLLGDKASLTISLFCFEESGIWKIDQIQISDWEIF